MFKLFSATRSPKNEDNESIYELYYIQGEVQYKCGVIAESFKDAVAKLQAQSPNIHKSMIFDFKVYP